MSEAAPASRIRLALSPGSALGPYQVVAAVGAGGMGEVYRARDSRLGRDIALKVLNDEASGLAERRARFEREARAAAALNHPNIVSVYDFGVDNGRFYIASELIEGESLRELIRRGSIGVRELYRIAVQFADGMAAAHAAGITHRDLKPENIMLTGDGHVKILDFGLARQGGAKRSLPTGPADTTVTQLDTQPGTVLGTVSYMSPEQAGGLDLDHRSDQFSFGAILYEMATGARPFTKETSVETMAAILKEEPKPIEAKIPAPLRWTIARCLEKDPAARYESTRNLYRELLGQQEHLSDIFTSAEAVVASAPAVPLRSRLHWAVAAISLAIAGAAVWFATHRPSEISRYRFTPMEVSWANPQSPVWSPDGKAFAYSAEVNGIRQVFLRYLNSPTPVQLTHSENDAYAFGWSSDSKRVIFGKQPGAVFSVPIFGGDAQPLFTSDMQDFAAFPSPDLFSFDIATKQQKDIGDLAQDFVPSSELSPGIRLSLSPDGKSILYPTVQYSGSLWMLEGFN